MKIGSGPSASGADRRAQVRVSIRGKGRPLLLVMGIGGSLDMWRPLECELVPRGYRTISFDLPGAGASPPVFPPLRMPGLARIALGVLEALEVPEADVLGSPLVEPSLRRWRVTAATASAESSWPPPARDWAASRRDHECSCT